jgi:hypothetical protein
MGAALNFCRANRRLPSMMKAMCCGDPPTRNAANKIFSYQYIEVIQVCVNVIDEVDVT